MSIIASKTEYEWFKLYIIIHVLFLTGLPQSPGWHTCMFACHTQQFFLKVLNEARWGGQGDEWQKSIRSVELLMP